MEKTENSFAGEKVLCLFGFYLFLYAGAYVEPSEPDFQIVSRLTMDESF
jgi:hypothetical protein